MVILQPLLAFLRRSSKLAILFALVSVNSARSNPSSNLSSSGKSSKLAVLPLEAGYTLSEPIPLAHLLLSLANTALPSPSSEARKSPPPSRPVTRGGGAKLPTYLHNTRYAGPAARPGLNLPPQPWFSLGAIVERKKCGLPFVSGAVKLRGDGGAGRLVRFWEGIGSCDLRPAKSRGEKDSGQSSCRVQLRPHLSMYLHDVHYYLDHFRAL